MGQKDLAEKNLEYYPDVFADTVNALLYQGKQVLLPDNLQAAPTETLYPVQQETLRNQFHDVSKYEMDHGRIRAQYTLENESVDKRKTVLRKAGYEGAVYRGQYDGENVYPFVSLILFWGKSRWRAPKSLRQLFSGNIPQQKYIDNVHLHVYEMAHLPQEVREHFHSDMRIIVDYLAERKNYVPSRQKIVHLEALLLTLKALTGDNRYEEIIPDMQENQRKTGGVSMCELLDKYENRGREAGIKAGRKAGRETVNELIRRLVGDGRADEIAKMAMDWDYQNRLLAEYGL